MSGDVDADVVWLIIDNTFDTDKSAKYKKMRYLKDVQIKKYQFAYRESRKWADNYSFKRLKPFEKR